MYCRLLAVLLQRGLNVHITALPAERRPLRPSTPSTAHRGASAVAGRRSISASNPPRPAAMRLARPLPPPPMPKPCGMPSPLPPPTMPAMPMPMPPPPPFCTAASWRRRPSFSACSAATASFSFLSCLHRRGGGVR